MVLGFRFEPDRGSRLGVGPLGYNPGGREIRQTDFD